MTTVKDLRALMVPGAITTTARVEGVTEGAVVVRTSRGPEEITVWNAMSYVVGDYVRIRAGVIQGKVKNPGGQEVYVV